MSSVASKRLAKEFRQRELSRSDAIVVPQHFLSTATLFVCLHASRLHDNSQHINTRAVREEEERQRAWEEENRERAVKVKRSRFWCL